MTLSDTHWDMVAREKPFCLHFVDEPCRNVQDTAITIIVVALRQLVFNNFALCFKITPTGLSPQIAPRHPNPNERRGN